MGVRAGQDRGNTGTMACERAVGMHDNPNGHGPFAERPAERMVMVGNGDKISKTNFIEPQPLYRGAIVSHDIAVAGSNIIMSHPGTHKLRRDDGRDADFQSASGKNAHGKFMENRRIQIIYFDVGKIDELEALSVAFNQDLVIDT